MSLATKLDIERQIEGKELPFYTVSDAVSFGHSMVAATKEAEELKQQTQYMARPGMMNYSQLGPLDLTEMRDFVYGELNITNENEESSDTVPQITEDSRDVSPSQSHDKKQDMEREVVSAEENTKPKKKDNKDLDAKQRDSKQKVRSDIENRDMSKGRDYKGEEISHDEVYGKENQMQKLSDKKELPMKSKHNIQGHSHPKGKDAGIHDKVEQNKQQIKKPESYTSIKENQQVHSRTTDVIYRDSDPKIGSEIRQTRETVLKTMSQEKSTPMQQSGKTQSAMSARLNGAREAARASNMMQSIANITQATSRTITVRHGNDIFMTEKEGDQTFAYINGQKVGAQEASKFFEKMNAEQGPGKTMQLETMIKQAALNPAIQAKNMAEEHAKAHKSKHAEKSGKERGER